LAGGANQIIIIIKKPAVCAAINFSAGFYSIFPSFFSCSHRFLEEEHTGQQAAARILLVDSRVPKKGRS
jgi:hypothetical protein